MTVRGKNGRPRTIPAPESEKLSRQVPELAFIDPDRYDRVIRLLVERNAKYKRSESVRNDPRAGIPKRQTRWPGQHLRCGVCGRMFVFGGHGKTERLMCTGVREYKCWNALTVSGPDAARAVAERTRELITDLPNIDNAWGAEYEVQRQARLVESHDELNRLQRELDSATRKLANLFDLSEKIGASEATVERIREAELRIAFLKDQMHLVQREQQNHPVLPSLDEIKLIANDVFSELAVESSEFSRQMHNAIDEFFVLPYQLVDSGHIQPRLTFQVSPFKLVNDFSCDSLPIQTFDCVVDLAKKPKRLTHLDDVVRMVGQGMKHAEVASQLGIFKSEVGYAMKLHREMVALGVDDPWVPVVSVEQAREHYKRVRNPRFDFKPLEGFETTRHPKS